MKRRSWTGARVIENRTEYFRDQLIAAQLKLVVVRQGGDHGAKFHDPLIAALLQLGAGQSHGKTQGRIPRSPDRGPIQGADRRFIQVEMAPFRDHLFAAPLKYGQRHHPRSSQAPFRDHLIAAPLKWPHARGMATRHHVISRSPDRGPIEVAS